MLTSFKDTCRDVPHKKRGRPRLREDTEFRIDPTGALETLPEGEGILSPPRSDRPIAQIRHRRGDSFRLLRSHASSISSVGSLPSPVMYMPSGHSMHAIGSQPPAPTHIVPIAFLDLDLVIMKANSAFQHLFAGLQEIRGRRLTDIARPADGDSFQTLRNRLREEREARDPAYLPPILQQNYDPLGDTSERDVDEVTRGFDDRQYAWTYNLAAGMEQTLTTRVRLAKTSTVYFVTLALPPLPSAQAFPFLGQVMAATSLSSPPTNVLAHAPQQMPPPQESATARRGSIAHSAPPSPFYPYQSSSYIAVSQGPSGPQAGGSRSYPPPQSPLQPYQPTQYQSSYRSPPSLAPMQPVAEPSSMTSAADPFTPHFGPRRLSQPVPPRAQDVQRPAPPTPSSSTGFQQQSPPQMPAPTLGRQQSTSSESGPEGSVRSPKKRRRMDIGDVLQK